VTGIGGNVGVGLLTRTRQEGLELRSLVGRIYGRNALGRTGEPPHFNARPILVRREGVVILDNEGGLALELIGRPMMPTEPTGPYPRRVEALTVNDLRDSFAGENDRRFPDLLSDPGTDSGPNVGVGLSQPIG
jgi:hypothetical protein